MRSRQPSCLALMIGMVTPATTNLTRKEIGEHPLCLTHAANHITQKIKIVGQRILCLSIQDDAQRHGRRRDV